jgi:hypothetical protein
MTKAFESFLWGLNWASNVTTVIVLIAVGRRLILWMRGISPALRGLGKGLASRKIALFATGPNMTSLKQSLTRSKLFREKNLIEIQQIGDIGNAEEASVFVMYWPDWSGELENILSRKRDATPLIVYCPRTAGQIPQDQMEAIDGHRNTAVSNFRGRLLNDIVTAMITTSYE